MSVRFPFPRRKGRHTLGLNEPASRAQGTLETELCAHLPEGPAARHPRSGQVRGVPPRSDHPGRPVGPLARRTLGGGIRAREAGRGLWKPGELGLTCGWHSLRPSRVVRSRGPTSSSWRRPRERGGFRGRSCRRCWSTSHGRGSIQRLTVEGEPQRRNTSRSTLCGCRNGQQGRLRMIISQARSASCCLPKAVFSRVDTREAGSSLQLDHQGMTGDQKAAIGSW